MNGNLPFFIFALPSATRWPAAARAAEARDQGEDGEPHPQGDQYPEVIYSSGIIHVDLDTFVLSNLVLRTVILFVIFLRMVTIVLVYLKYSPN